MAAHHVKSGGVWVGCWFTEGKYRRPRWLSHICSMSGAAVTTEEGEDFLPYVHPSKWDIGKRKTVNGFKSGE